MNAINLSYLVFDNSLPLPKVIHLLYIITVPVCLTTSLLTHADGNWKVRKVSILLVLELVSVLLIGGLGRELMEVMGTCTHGQLCLLVLLLLLSHVPEWINSGP